MPSLFQRFAQQLPAFLFLGMAIALMFGLFVVFIYLLFWGAILGVLLWAGMSLKQYFFPQKQTSKQKNRIIDHDSQQ
jgi:Na+/H+ antiporter NhaC